MKLMAAFTAGVLAGGALLHFAETRPPARGRTASASSAVSQPAVVAAAQGRVEGRTENIEVGAAADGVIHSLLVREGQRVAMGQAIAHIGCDNLMFEIQALEATLESVRQGRARLLRGSREEERRGAGQEVSGAHAVLDQARRQYERMQILVAKDDVSRETAEKSQRDLATAEASLGSALERQNLVNAGPLPEEIAKADADVAAIADKLRATQAQRDKCVVRAPIAGTITRVYMRAGEAFSTVLPRPIVSMADLSGRRIRAEIDERDLTKIHVPQRVLVAAEGRPPFGGKVIWTSPVMGRKTARSADPAERSDRDILEALISPDTGTPDLPLGLRVVVEFLQ